MTHDVSFFLDTDEINGILNGAVEAIFRTSLLGGPFDTFRIEGRSFFFRSISALDLEEVARMMFSSCGYESAEEFSEDLRSTDPSITEHTTVYTHHIAECVCDNCAVPDCNGPILCSHWRRWTL
ncbi:MAG: hypothetical protein IJX35_00520 [Candidatus Methanomethylophilaceae archaeon]|nr:hypothetical protein [Candidatus Methanomethylophilaceae archaeon]